jgi:hypothetical protein
MTTAMLKGDAYIVLNPTLPVNIANIAKTDTQKKA